ncbi:MAG TPA: IS66 family transposase [Planctomycetaceae bacterium]|nr:IS66 family transposase [Planctomycetaceae bacterium]
MNDGSSWPHDVDACHRLIEQLSARLSAQDAALQQQAHERQAHEAFVAEQLHTLDELADARQRLAQENDELKLTVRKLLDRLYGRRSERFVVDPAQLSLDFGDDTAATVEVLAEAVWEAERTIEEVQSQRRARRRKQRVRSEKFPEHLPRYEQIVDLPEDQKVGKVLIGYDAVETLEFERARLRVRVTKYAKYAVANNPPAGVSSPPRPTGLVEGNRFDTSVAVEILADRFFYHLPYYRQQDMFAGCGWTPSRSTLLNIVAASEFVLQPLVRYYRRLLGEIDLLGCDETPVTLIVPPQLPPLDPQDPRAARISEVLSAALAQGRPSVQARMWAYRSLELPFNVFDFTVSRHRDGPDEMLADFRGILLGDCWSGFQKIELRSDARIRRAACWAHARRKLDGCRTSQPRHSTVLLALVQQLYDLEERAAAWTAAQRLALRQTEALPVLQKLRAYLDGPAGERLLPKSDLAVAIGYLKHHWEALLLYTTDGRLPIDNNLTEQLMKQIATGRKNWLQVGSVAAGCRAANLMTIISTAARNDLDVWSYLKDVLDRILSGCTDWESLRADVWKSQHPDAVRAYRVEERRDAIDRRRLRHARRRLAARATK